MFSNNRYLTCGVDSTIPLELQLFLWECIDRLPAPKDYLQVFELSPSGTMQSIIHSSEEPEYRKVYMIPSDSPMMVGSLFNWQMSHDSGFLSIAIDELIDQDFSTGSPLQTIVKQGRKFHTALIGATQDFYNQGSSNLDVMKQANIKSFCHPGKSEDRVAQKLGYSNAADAGFNKFKAGDTILEFDGYNKETGENEALTLKGRVVNFIESPLYEKFKEIYGC